MQPKAVVYDIGRVLIHWDPRGFYDRVIGPEARARLFAEVDLDGMNIRVDNGSYFNCYYPGTIFGEDLTCYTCIATALG